MYVFNASCSTTDYYPVNLCHNSSGWLHFFVTLTNTPVNYATVRRAQLSFLPGNLEISLGHSTLGLNHTTSVFIYLFPICTLTNTPVNYATVRRAQLSFLPGNLEISLGHSTLGLNHTTSVFIYLF